MDFTLFFCGTGAADNDWNQYGVEPMRGSTQTLVNGKVLIDAGQTGFRALKRFQIDMEGLEEVWFTHSHDDHCFMPEIAQLLVMHSTQHRPLILRGSQVLLDFLLGQLPKELLPMAEPIPTRLGVPFYTQGWIVTPLLANHATNLPDELCQHYLVRGATKNFLYALDGAWMTTRVRLALAKLHLDAIIWDATVEKPRDYRIYEHNDFTMVRTLTQGLRDAGIVDDKTILVLDHVAHTLWANPIRVPAPYKVAEDGMTVNI